MKRHLWKEGAAVLLFLLLAALLISVLSAVLRPARRGRSRSPGGDWSPEERTERKMAVHGDGFIVQ